MSTLFLLLVSSAAAQETGPEATRVYGQPDFASNAAGHDANGLFFPIGLAEDSSGGVYVADRNNSRVLYYASDGDTTADRVYGQHDELGSYTQNYDGVGGSGLPSAETLNFPVAISLDADDGLYVTDRENHRVLYYAPDGDTTADRVYGQFDKFTTNPPNNDGLGGNGLPSAASIGVFALGVLADSSGGLYISDSSNNRVLYFEPGGDTNADFVYGQFGNFTSGAKNNDGSGQPGTPSAESLNFPRGSGARQQWGGCTWRTARIIGSSILPMMAIRWLTGCMDTVAVSPVACPTMTAPGTPAAPRRRTSTNRRPWPWMPTKDSMSPTGTITACCILPMTAIRPPTGCLGSSAVSPSNVANNDGSGASGAPSAQNLNHPQFVMVAADGSLYISDTGNNRVLVLPPDVLPDLT